MIVASDSEVISLYITWTKLLMHSVIIDVHMHATTSTWLLHLLLKKCLPIMNGFEVGPSPSLLAAEMVILIIAD